MEKCEWWWEGMEIRGRRVEDKQACQGCTQPEIGLPIDMDNQSPITIQTTIPIYRS